jgi:hypothetical protein
MIVLKQDKIVNFHFLASKQNVSYVLTDIDWKLSGIYWHDGLGFISQRPERYS